MMDFPSWNVVYFSIFPSCYVQIFLLALTHNLRKIMKLNSAESDVQK
jgi:hypothetical protein